MNEIFLQIAKITGSSPCEVEKIFEAFKKLANADYEEREEMDEQSPIVMLKEWCNEEGE